VGQVEVGYAKGARAQVICTKVRDGDKRIVRLKEGVAKGRHVVIVDDLVQSGGTLIECQRLLTTQVPRRARAAGVHSCMVGTCTAIQCENTGDHDSYCPAAGSARSSCGRACDVGAWTAHWAQQSRPGDLGVVCDVSMSVGLCNGQRVDRCVRSARTCSGTLHRLLATSGLTSHTRPPAGRAQWR